MYIPIDSWGAGPTLSQHGSNCFPIGFRDYGLWSPALELYILSAVQVGVVECSASPSQKYFLCPKTKIRLFLFRHEHLYFVLKFSKNKFVLKTHCIFLSCFYSINFVSMNFLDIMILLQKKIAIES